MNHEIITHDVEPPSNLEMFVGMVSKTADEQASGWLKSITIRMPMVTALTFEAIASYSGQSRNKLMVKALETALDLLWEQLPEVERAELEHRRSDLLAQAMSEGVKEAGEV